MSKWEKKLDRVFERVLEDSEGEVSVLKTTSDSDFSEGTLSSKDCARADAERIQAHEERKVYMEMCALLDNTLHLTVDTILNNGDGRGHGDGDTDTPAKEFTIRKDSTELPYHHDRGTTLSSLALIDVEGIDEEGDTIPLSSSSSSPSSTSSLMSISAVELCLLKRQLEDMQEENDRLKEDNVQLHQLLMNGDNIDKDYDKDKDDGDDDHDDVDTESYIHKCSELTSRISEYILSPLSPLMGDSSSTSTGGSSLTGAPTATYIGEATDSEGGSSCITCGCTCAQHEVEEKALVAELVHTKCLLALALSKVEEEKLHRYKIMRSLDALSL